MKSPSRKSCRLSDFDYGKQGAYSLTICTQDMDCLFGRIIEKEMILNDAGRMVENALLNLHSMYPHIQIDTYIIMPNHIHVIVFVNDIALDHRSRGRPPCLPVMNRPPCLPARTDRIPVPVLVQRYKSYTTNQYMRGVNNHNWPCFNRRLWQRNYYDHIIRNPSELNCIRKYISENPKRWKF